MGLEWRYLACIEAGEYIDPERGYSESGLVEV